MLILLAIVNTVSYKVDAAMDFKENMPIILNGDSPAPTRVIEGVLQPVTPTTAEQRLAKKNELKSRGTLLMALPDKHQLKFNTHKDAKTLMMQKLISQLEILGVSLSQEDINLKFLRSIPSDWRTHTLIWRNKTYLEEQSLDDLFNSLKIYEAKVKSSSSTSTSTQNIAFVSSSNTDSTNKSVSTAASVSAVSAKIPVFTLLNVDSLSNVVIYLFFASQFNSPQLDNDDLKQIDATGRNLRVNGPTSMGFDMHKVACYNCHRKGHFAREYSYDWSFQVEEEPTNYALMAFSSLSSSSDNESTNKTNLFLKKTLNYLNLKFSDESSPPSPIYDRYQSSNGYHDVPLLYTRTFMPPKPNLVFNNALNDVETEHLAFTIKISPIKPDQDMSHTYRPSAPIIEDWVSDSEDESETKTPQNVSSFVQSTEQVKTPRLSVQHVQTFIPTATSKTAILKPTSNGKHRNRKACFVCKNLDYLIKDCDYHDKKMAQTTPRTTAQRGTHKKYAQMTLLNPQRHVVLAVVLPQSKLIPITAVRPVSTDVPKPSVTRPRHDKPVVTKTNSPPRRIINCSPSPKASNSPPIVTAVKAPMVNAAKMCDKKNSFLSTDTECLVLSLEFKLLDESQGLLRVPRENNTYNVNLNNIVSFRDLTCLFAKATLDESNIWHRRLGHINFKTMNKLVKGEDIVQQYVLFPVWSSGYTNPHNTDGDAAFDEKEPEFDEKKPESKVNVSPSSSAQSKKHDDKTKREAKGKILVESLTGYRNLSAYAVGPSNAAASPTHGKSSCIDTSQLPDDPNMIELEDITYSDDEDDVGVEADFNNLETSITVSPIPTTKVYKDHPVTQTIGIKRMKEALWSGTKLDLLHKDIQEEGIDYEEVFAPVARIEAIRLFLAYASFMGFMVYQIDVKSDFLYGTIKEEVYICQPLGFEDSNYPDKVYKVVKALYGLHQAPRSCQDKYVAKILRKFRMTDGKSASTPIDTKKPLLKDPDDEDVDVDTYRSMIGSLMYLTSLRPNIMFAVCACARFQVTPKALYLHAVKRIFRYLKGKSHLGLWYLKDSLFDLVAYSDSDYAGASLDRKSTTKGCQFLGCRLISWQCKKQTVVATSSTEAEYVAAASCCAQVLWIQNQLLDYGYTFMHTIFYIDNSRVNKPRSDEDRLKLMELKVFLLPIDEKVGVEVSAVDLQVSTVRLILLLLVQKFLLFGLTNWYCSLNAGRSQINPNIYVSCIKQFWTSVAVKNVNDVTRLQALVDKKKVVIMEASIRYALHLDDAEGVVEGDDDEVHVEDVNAAGVATEGVVSAVDDIVPTFNNPQPKHLCVLHKQFWTTVAVKKVNDVIRLQAVVDKKKLVVMEATIREVLYLDDAEGVECLPNEAIFAELARMGYEKPSTKLTFYKAFFSSQWKFLIYTILQCMSAKRTSWNEFSSSMASAVICLSSAQEVAEEGNVEVHGEEINVGDTIEGDVSAAHGDVPTVSIEPSIPSPTPPTPPPQPPQVQPPSPQPQQQPQPTHNAGIAMNLLQEVMDTCTALSRRVEHLELDKIA
nr:uncharacterized mitochondrial protein AtMg00810-like [Tanacetum cinerariifolium]